MLHSSSSIWPKTKKRKQVKFVSDNKCALISLDDFIASESTSNQLTTNNIEIDEGQQISVPPLIVTSNINDFMKFRKDRLNRIDTQN